MPAASRPIYVKIAEQLQEVAHDPDDLGRVFSVRKVASQYGVSAVTASRALQLFRLGTSKPSRPAAARAKGSPKTRERWAVCLHVSPGPHQHAAAQLTADGFRALNQGGPIAFDFDSLRLGESNNEQQISAQVNAAVERGAEGIFLSPSRVSSEAMRVDEALLEASAEAGVPVVLLERNLRGEDRQLTNDLVSFHDFEGGRLLTRHLVDQGRRRIAFLTGSPTSSHAQRVAGYLSAMHTAGLHETFVIEQPARTSPGETYTDIAAQLIDRRADGVICFHEYAAVGVVMELLRRGKSIPDDTAVAAFYGLGLGQSFSIGITSYSFPAQTVAARALDIMRWRIQSPDAPPLMVIIPGELIVRNSTTGQAES